MTHANGNPAAPAAEQAPLFIVTSGRSGSTHLARLLHSHPDVVVISDLLEPVGPMPYFDRNTMVTGAEFWEMLSVPSHPERIKRWRCSATEELLYLPPDDDDVSLLMAYTLPFLAGPDPTGLAHELAQATRDRPVAPVAEHFVRTCGWLRDRFGGERWVERTGGSLPHAQSLVDCFREAKFVHLHRDPLEVAISMCTGSFFKLYQALEVDSSLPDWSWSQGVGPSTVGEMLCRWELSAVEAFQAVPEEHFMTLPYESLLADPAGVLRELVAFLLDRPLEPKDAAWADRVAGATAAPPRRFPELRPDQQLDLVRSTALAREALGYA